MENIGPGELSEGELRHRLERLRPCVPLSVEELETVREIIKEWNFQQMLKTERSLESEAKRARWPLIATVVSVSTSVLLWLATFLASHWPFGGGGPPK